MTTEKFLENLLVESQKYPFGLPKEKQRKWEDLSEDEKTHWNHLAKNPLMKIYKYAHMAFELKQSKGIPEELSEEIFEKEFDWKENDILFFRNSFDHFMEGHKIKSRKNMEKKFGNKS